MPLSKNIIAKESAEQVAIEYKPVTIGTQLSEQAMEYVKNHEARGDFRVDKIVSEFTGIEELERQSQQKEIADQALELSKEVQENAYREAYDLGLKEGTEKAYAEEKERVENEMVIIRNLIDEINQIKNNLYKENEKQIVKLCFYMAKRLLMKEIESDESYVQSLIKKTLEMAQSDEDVIIRVSPEDKIWLDKHEDSVFKDLGLDPSTKIEEDRQISRGGIIVETNHGVIDATVEQRLDKLENMFSDQS